MPIRETIPDNDPQAVALEALVWVLGDRDRADRLLVTTGLDPIGLRARAGQPATLAAVLNFIEAYEPDLIACAEHIGIAPAALVRARTMLETR
jgi:adenine/guanine phosphoribosyltransferase-like PRPP-binding protein